MFEQEKCINIHEYCDDPCKVGLLNQEIAKATMRDILDVEIDKINIHGQTPLTIACACGNVKAVDILLHAGADPEKPNNVGLSPARVLKKNGGICGKILELLCEHMAEPIS